jgi:hypothetical protein
MDQFCIDDVEPLPMVENSFIPLEQSEICDSQPISFLQLTADSADLEIEPSSLFEPLPPIDTEQFANFDANAEWASRAGETLAMDDTTLLEVLRRQASLVRQDHVQFYSASGLKHLVVGVGAGALMANTGFDEHFLRDSYAENIVLAPSDEVYELLHEPKFLGNGMYTIPAFMIVSLAESWIDSWPLGKSTAEWGQRSLRTILVGGPPMLGLQWLVGGSRPGESGSSSDWTPFQDNNGVSGHSFMGAVPFLSAAMMAENAWLKSGLYFASVLPALSRVNDDDHYFSQAFLGWWLAYVAARAVDRSPFTRSSIHIVAYPAPDGIGLGIDYAW